MRGCRISLRIDGNSCGCRLISARRVTDRVRSLPTRCFYTVQNQRQDLSLCFIVMRVCGWELGPRRNRSDHRRKMFASCKTHAFLPSYAWLFRQSPRNTLRTVPGRVSCEITPINRGYGIRSREQTSVSLRKRPRGVGPHFMGRRSDDGRCTSECFAFPQSYRNRSPLNSRRDRLPQRTTSRSKPCPMVH